MTLEESIELERVKHALQCELERQKSEYAQKIPAMSGAFSYASETIKSLVLLNGGAAIALLSFAGNAIPRYVAPNTVQIGRHVDSLTKSLNYFIIGLVAASLASGCSYFSQIFFNENILPNVITNRRRAEWARVLAMAFAITSITMFAFGSYSSARALQGLAMMPKGS